MRFFGNFIIIITMFPTCELGQDVQIFLSIFSYEFCLGFRVASEMNTAERSDAV
jgi:hypothetical protein